MTNIEETARKTVTTLETITESNTHTSVQTKRYRHVRKTPKNGNEASQGSGGIRTVLSIKRNSGMMFEPVV